MAERPPATAPPWRRPIALVPLLLVLFAILTGQALRRESATFDETAHLPAGLSYLERGDFRLGPDHPPLGRIWAALPVWLAGRGGADYDGPAWRGRPVGRGELRSGADYLRFGFDVLNGPPQEPARRDPLALLVPARTMVVVLGLALGLVVFAWARSLWGEWGGVLALFLYVTSPTVLAHGRLVTTDMPAALGYLATCWLAWRFALRPGWLRGTLLGLALGAALLGKHSCLLLPPLVAAGLATAAALRARREPGAADLRRLLAPAAAAAALALVTVWAGYGFRWSASADPEYVLPWDEMAAERSVVVRSALLARDHLPLLPEAYLYGVAEVAHRGRLRLAYLNGETSLTGWWYYFPEAFLLKTPPAVMVLLAWVALAALGRLKRRARDLPFLVLPPAVYLLVSITANLNLGHRHLLPVYPFLFVAAGAAVPLVRGSRWRTGALAALCAGAAWSSAAAAPGHLSYFNRLAGGTAGGSRYLVDSNIDWGQDLPRLRAWMEREGIGEIHLAYFGTADPRAYGVRYRKVYQFPDFRPWEPAVRPGPGELLAISETLRRGAYLDRDREFANEAGRRGWITRADLEAWRSAQEQGDRTGDPYRDLASWLVRRGRLTERQRREAEQPLLSTWILDLVERLEPSARVGGSILVYRVP